MKSRLLSNIILAAALALHSGRAQETGAGEVLLQAAEQKELVEGDLKAAIRIYEQAVNGKGAGRAVVAKALLHIGKCYEKLGSAEARKAYQRVAQQYADQTAAAAEAHKRLSALAGPARRSINGEMLLHRLPFSPDAFYVQSDGKILIYVDSETGDLVASDLAGGRKRILKRANQSTILLPHLSPDGSKVEFTIQVGTNYISAVVNTDGGGFHTILNCAEWTSCRGAGWTRDNTAVLVTMLDTSKHRHRLIKVRESDSFIQELAVTGTSWVRWASYSPDGKFIASWTISEEGSGEVVEIMSADGSRQGTLVAHSGSNKLIDWTPDGKAILFSSDRSGQPALYKQDVVQGRPQGGPILIREGVTWGTLTADGSLIYRPQTFQSRVYVIKADFEKGTLSGLPQPASDLYPNGQWTPAWSPNGSELAISIHNAQSEADRFEILVIPLSAGQPRRIATSDRIGDLVWAADGRSIYTASPVRGKGGVIRRFSLEAGAASQVLSTPQDLGVGRMQMDNGGRALLFNTSSPTPRLSKLVRYDLETGEPTELATRQGLAAFSVSRDGRWVAASDFLPASLSASRSTLSIRALEGEEWRQIVDLEGKGIIERLEWTPDGRSIVYAVRRYSPGAASTSMFQIAASGGTPRKLADLPGRVDCIAIHPDGTKLAFSSFGGKAELWMLENFMNPKPAVR